MLRCRLEAESIKLKAKNLEQPFKVVIAMGLTSYHPEQSS